MFFDNHIIISDYQDIDLNFKNYLKNKDSLIFKRCKNINITIDSKINKLIFLKSKNIKFLKIWQNGHSSMKMQ